VLRRDHQHRVDTYFDSVSSYWADVYGAQSLEGVIYRQRRAVVLGWADGLSLARGSKVLEVGCGAGFTTVALARRGYTVDAVDSSETMVELATRSARESGVEDRVSVFRGDANALPVADEGYDLVVAIGVVPWLESPGSAVREMARTVMPGGHVVLTSDNRDRLTRLLDPRFSPVLGPPRRLLKRVLEGAGLRKPRQGVELHHLRSLSSIDKIVSQNRLETVQALTLGFGPFSFLGRTILPDKAGVVLHHRLQGLADRGVAGLRRTGSQYLVLARKFADLQ
jgi:ubiquinone/menaquinone biosynthesis C-methylase UbiE